MNFQKNKSRSMILAIGILLCLLLVFSLAVFAPGSEGSPASAEVTYVGDGTAANPYQIWTAEQLAGISENFHYSATGALTYYKLMDDIDLTDYLKEGGDGHNDGAGWLPIGRNLNTAGGTPSHWFTGVFDGANHTVSGLWINRPTDAAGAGLFRYLRHMGTNSANKSIVKNLTVETAEAGIVAKDNAGILAGGAISSTIENCTVSGNITVGSGGNAGGLLPYARECTIKQCEANVTITSLNFRAGIVGGLIGKAMSVNVQDSFATGEMKGELPIYGGGFIGEFNSVNNATKTIIKNCYAAVDTIGFSAAGGFVGTAQLISSSIGNEIENCFATGTAYGVTSVGGSSAA